MSCEQCGKVAGDIAGGGTMMHCSVCRSINYCSADCQKENWPAHKKVCTQIATKVLIQAIIDNDIDTVTRLSTTKRVVNGKVDFGTARKTLGGWTALHECVRQSNLEALRILAATSDVKIDMRDADGETPCFVAASARAPDIIQVLLEAGANPNAQAGDGWSALMMAARNGDHRTVELLLQHGASIEHGRDMFGRSVVDLVDTQQTGQGVRCSEGETMQDGIQRAKRVQEVLFKHMRGSR